VCLVVNIAVFVAWQILPRRFMIENFTLSHNLFGKRYWTLVTYAFSHETLDHLLANMACLVSFGPTVVQKLGPTMMYQTVAGTSIFAGIFAMFLQPFHLMFWPQQYREAHQVSLGFSGVNAAILYLFAEINPRAKLIAKNLPSMPAKRAVMYLMGFDLIGMLLDMTILPSPIGHSNHLGGYLSAALITYILCSTPIGRQWGTRKQRTAFTRQNPVMPEVEQALLIVALVHSGMIKVDLDQVGKKRSRQAS
jgi:membrane associated rhomboid family serine protease